MNATKKKKLEAAGWKFGSAFEFLEISEAEGKMIDIRVDLAIQLKALRTELGLTQSDVAKAIKSSQSRVAKMEIADQSVSTDLLIKSLFRLGATRPQVGSAVSGGAYRIDKKKVAAKVKKLKMATT